MNTTTLSQAAQPWTRFQDCLNAYGAQRQAWPDADRSLYDQFATTVAGQQAMQPARDLDVVLTTQTGDPGSLSPDFLIRLQTMSLPPQNKPQNYLVVVWRRHGAIMLLLIAALLGGVNGYTDTTDLNRVWSSGTMTTAFGVASR